MIYSPVEIEAVPEDGKSRRKKRIGGALLDKASLVQVVKCIEKNSPNGLGLKDSQLVMRLKECVRDLS